MHTLVEVNSGNTQGTHVPAFLAKLWKLVDDQATNDLIYWSEMGNSFIIRNQAKFARDLLPLYYKHNNMASFVRQLNMYGFHKVVSVEQGGLKVDKDEMEFAHPFFLRGQEPSLELIKRKIPTAKHDDSRVRPDSLQKVLMDVRHMKGKQENIDSKLITMKRENEALWRELASLRQKHAKQTQIVSKLLQFLVGMMSSQTHRLGFKRRMPLMLSDADGAKVRKHGRNEAQEDLSGPVIHDVTELFEADDSEDEQDHSDYLTGSSGSDGDTHPKVDSPKGASSKSPYPESILGLSPDSPELLSVDPSTVNPAIKVLADLVGNNVQNDRVKVKSNKKVSSAAPTAENPNVIQPNHMMNVSHNRGQGLQGTARQFIPIKPQPSSSTNMGQGNQINNPATSSFYQGQPVVNEPVQFILSIPEQTRVQTNDIGVNTDAVTITTSTSTVSQPVTSNLGRPQTLTTTSNTDMVPIMSDSVVGMPRNHSQALTPQFLMKPKVTEDFDVHLDDMQVGLDNLKDILKSDDYKMDHSTMLGLFGDTDLGNFDFNKHIQETQIPGGDGMSNLSGQEVVSYNPSLFELTEDDSQFFDDTSNVYLDDELESMLTTDRTRLSKSQLQRGSPATLSFAAALNGQQQDGSNGSGITTPVGTGSVLGAVSTPTTTPHGLSAVSPANISGAGKRKRK